MLRLQNLSIIHKEFKLFPRNTRWKLGPREMEYCAVVTTLTRHFYLLCCGDYFRGHVISTFLGHGLVTYDEVGCSVVVFAHR